MTNKTTPDEDWLRSLLADYKIGFVVGDKDVEQHLSAFVAAINAKITELLIAENTLACMAWENNPALPATYLMERTKQLQASMFLGDGELIDSEEDSPWQE
jgi:hypothetical protein